MAKLANRRNSPPRDGSPVPDESFTPEQEAWLNSRPPEIAAVARRWPPTRMYRMPSTGQFCAIVGYRMPDEGGAVTLSVNAWRTTELGEPIDVVEVFGVPPEQLEPVALTQDTGS